MEKAQTKSQRTIEVKTKKPTEALCSDTLPNIKDECMLDSTSLQSYKSLFTETGENND